MKEDTSKSRGSAFIMVIIVLTALGIILSEFVFSTRVSLNAVRNYKNEKVGYYLALGAFQMALAEITEDYQYLLRGDGGGVIFIDEEDVKSAEGINSIRSGEVEGAGKYSYQIIDEESKMNVNRVQRKELVKFFRAFGLNMGAERDIIVDSILDWRDKDELHRLNGAEDDYYQSLVPPYYPGNGEFESITELLLVRGITPELYAQEGDEWPNGLSDLLTVYGEGLNYNTAPKAVLEAVFSEEEAANIISTRLSEPYEDEHGRSQYFTVIARGWAKWDGGGRGIKAVVKISGHGQSKETVILQWQDVDFASLDKDGQS